MMPVKADLVICSSLIGVTGYIVQECGFHVKPLLGYQFLRDCSGFLQIQSHIFIRYYFTFFQYVYVYMYV